MVKIIGEDNYYINIMKNNNNYYPIQFGCFKINSNSYKEYKMKVNKICSNVEKFIKNNWNEYDYNICDELIETTDILKINCDKIKTIILRYHIKTRMLYLFINHSVVGGGDYLVLGSVIFNGKTNSLIPEPKNNVKDIIMTKLFKLHFMFDVFRLLYFKTPREKLKSGIIIKTILYLKNMKFAFIKTKYIIINNILKNIMNSITDKDKLICWIPIGFQKSGTSPNNNIGIVLFEYTRNMTIFDLQELIESKKHFAIGSRELLIDSYNTTSNFENEESKIKKNIDVVLTLANIIDNKEHINWGAGGMYYKMDILSPYPFYVWGLTMDDNVYLTYSVFDKKCNVQNLVKNTNGDVITDKYIFSLNK